ncbi:Retrovirus-related Pol polyprotein from transposon 17.6, partial [Mucuna pruriens]
MVRKDSGKWRMCIDYTDLNKACPKDQYPLPNIDRLVDGVSGFALLSFMDAYSGYNQIRMHLEDKEKTIFITDDGAFCYKVMSFGLKNAGATYQRLMNKIFRDIMGVDVEEYVDDIVVKSEMAKEHCKALELSPEKCSFRVQGGKFLGFMLIERGIEANPDKCQANVREVQQLMGRVTTLPCFISRASDTAMPILTTLKKERSFTWTPEYEEAFLRLKAILSTPPVLVWPDPGFPLYVYIFVLDAAISFVLIQERVTASRQLRPYFQNFRIFVQTDLPIRQVLRKPDLAGRMVTWSIQLLEFDISFEKRGHIKAQVLADFITELTPAPESIVGWDWYLSMDGSLNQAGSGAEVILEGPNDILIEQSFHFEFRASNNQAEYKALLACIRLALRLVTGQVNGEYQTKDPQLIKYWEKVTAMAASFESFTLLHVPMDQNERAIY